jgi:hypothetical protein
MVGIDMNAALRLGTARGCNLAVLSELLPAAEAGLVEAWCMPRKVVVLIELCGHRYHWVPAASLQCVAAT